VTDPFESQFLPGFTSLGTLWVLFGYSLGTLWVLFGYPEFELATSTQRGSNEDRLGPRGGQFAH